MQLFVAESEYTMWMISYPKNLREKIENPYAVEAVSFLSQSDVNIRSLKAIVSLNFRRGLDATKN